MKVLISTLLFAHLAHAAYVKPKDPITLMKDWKTNYRTLSCWQCFEAQGKMCHDKDNKSMIKTTGSSNPGHGLCCKPGYAGEHCNDDGEHVCS